jgi:hypothetical protein
VTRCMAGRQTLCGEGWHFGMYAQRWVVAELRTPIAQLLSKTRDPKFVRELARG